MSSSSPALDKGKGKAAPTKANITTREQRAQRHQAQVAALRRQAQVAVAQHKDQQAQTQTQHKDNQAQLQEHQPQQHEQHEQHEQHQQHEQHEQQHQHEQTMPQHRSQAGWGLAALLQAARAVHVQVPGQPEPVALQEQAQTVAQAALSPPLQVPRPQSTQTQTPELVLPTSELPPSDPVANNLSDIFTASLPPPPLPPTKPNKRKCKPQFKSDIWSRGHHRPAPGTGDPKDKKREDEGDTDTPPRQRKRQRKPGAPDSEDENDIPETPEEAEFIEDMNNASGLSLNTHRAYKVPFKRWREFCKNHKATYAGVDGKQLFLVDSEDKVIAFLKEFYFGKTSKKHVKLGADFKALVPVKFGPDGQCLPVDPGALVSILEEAEVDKNGCKVISVPLGNGSLQLAKKVLVRLHGFQYKRNQLSCSSPTEGSKYQDAVQRYRDGQVQQNLQSSRIRSADCAIRDSYTLSKFSDMVSYLWEKKSQEIRDPDLNYRELFCMTSRHNMLLRDEDLRNLNLSDCFASIITKPRHPGVQQLVLLTFKLNKGKTNTENQNWYGCCLRHEDVRRCSFSAFAFYMFQLLQNSDHPDLRGFVVNDVPLEFSKDEWDLFKMLPSPLDPTTSITPQATYNAVRKLYDRFHVNTSKKTHGGRHSGTVESNHLGIPSEVIKEGGRWMAERGKMETYYSSNLPSAFALGMAGFQDKPYYLSRNAVNPSIELQQMVFPWIEEVYGKDNDEWRKECEAEMAEVDTNIVPPISAGPSSTLAKALAESGESSKSAMMMAYQDRDIAKAGFLRLLVRCRRIILQDTAYRLHYKQKSLILNHEVFQSSLFTTFQQELGDFVDKPTPNTLQLAREAMPEIVGELQSMSARLHQQERSLLTFIRDHQQQLQDEIKQKEQALKEQKRYYENLLAQQQQSFNQRFPQHLQHPQHYHQQHQHQQPHYQQPHCQQHSLAPLIQLRGLIDSIIEQQQQQQPHFFASGPLTNTSFQGLQNLPHLSQPQVPAPHPPHQAFAPPTTSSFSSRMLSQAIPPILSTLSRDPQLSFSLSQRVAIPRLSSPAPAQAVEKAKTPKSKNKEKQFRFVVCNQKV